MVIVTYEYVSLNDREASIDSVRVMSTELKENFCSNVLRFSLFPW